MAFTVSVSESAKDLKLEYECTVSNGKIIDGQGSLAIKVDTKGLANGTNVKAEVKVNGLAGNCPNTFSGIGGIIKVITEPIDSYGKISFYDERARLQVSVGLGNNTETLGFIHIKIKKGKNFNTEKKQRIKNLFKHFRFLRIPFNRIIFGIEQTIESPEETFDSTTIWLVYKGARYPKCEKCEIIKADEFK
jgi:hypothetical protein